MSAAGTRVLIIDDVLATGGTAAAACRLVQGGRRRGCRGRRCGRVGRPGRPRPTDGPYGAGDSNVLSSTLRRRDAAHIQEWPATDRRRGKVAAELRRYARKGWHRSTRQLPDGVVMSSEPLAGLTDSAAQTPASGPPASRSERDSGPESLRPVRQPRAQGHRAEDARGDPAHGRPSTRSAARRGQPRNRAVASAGPAAAPVGQAVATRLARHPGRRIRSTSPGDVGHQADAVAADSPDERAAHPGRRRSHRARTTLRRASEPPSQGRSQGVAACVRGRGERAPRAVPQVRRSVHHASARGRHHPRRPRHGHHHAGRGAAARHGRGHRLQAGRRSQPTSPKRSPIWSTA